MRKEPNCCLAEVKKKVVVMIAHNCRYQFLCAVVVPDTVIQKFDLRRSDTVLY